MIRRFLVFLFGASLSACCWAAPVSQILPMRGAYWDAGAPGTGWQIEVGRNGFIFATGYVYTNAGAPTWVTLSGQFQPTSAAEYLSTGGTIGRLDGDLYAANGGQCLGCPFTTSTPVLVGTGASMVFTSSRTSEFRYNGQVTHLTRAVEIEASSTLEAMLLGSWRLKKYGPRTTVPPFDEVSIQDVGGGEYRISKRREERRVRFAERIGLPPINNRNLAVPAPDDTGVQYEMSCNTIVPGVENPCTYIDFSRPNVRNPVYGGTTSVGVWMANPVIYMDGPILRGVIACYTGINTVSPTPCEVQDGSLLRRRVLFRIDFIPQGVGDTFVVRVVSARFPSGELYMLDEFIMERVGD